MDDTVKAKRRSAMLEALRKPMTLEQLGVELRVSYHTLWRALKDLQIEGLVEETTWRQGREKVYIAKTSNKTGVITIVTPNGSQTLAGWIANEPYLTRPVADVCGALAQAWKYSAYVESSGVDKAKAGSMTLIECKTVLRGSLEMLKRYTLAIEQMLLAPIWDAATPENAEKFGDVNALAAIEIGDQFERRHLNLKG